MAEYIDRQDLIKFLDNIQQPKMPITEGFKYITIDGAIKVVSERPTANVIEIPEGAINGDMIKALFPNAEFSNAMPFTDGRWEVMNLDTENRTRAIYRPTVLRTYADWWNAPYKAESEGEDE